jgi:hypothetical protein
LDLRGRKQQEAGEDCIMRSLINYTLPYIIRMIKQNEMGRECSTYRRDEKYLQNFGLKT